ncbi:hypothetical protein SDRG_15868 [Saprolegnia diclina VS20]|uniref:Polysaccharide biosynthesis protein C-terminal domain-containing protein n=1 Tax=Saprolegnia diclina (strain VS20) TaxID=1156394 RepID=T0PVI1_SAPDV|nr:hypothetical protein SDRG_15868 [Saprolegnia diclina VS20]EQC26281.1 hypothetical protein SDRG_15868 [Saprolegnia diclina VS20]|eukprot:XP_008620276.1 hypothetical protein SDRG_15868 [Saprolegnia diclina VS20]
MRSLNQWMDQASRLLPASWHLSPRASAELDVLVRLGSHIAASILSTFALSVTALVIAKRVGTAEYTAVAYAQLVLDFTLTVFTRGFTKGLLALASQAYGAHNHALIGHYTQLTALLLTLVCVPLSLLWYYSCGSLHVVGLAPVSVALATQYARVSVLGLWPRLLFDVVAASFQAQQLAASAAVASLCAVVFNALLSIPLVFGLSCLGVRGLGVLGGPLATSLTLWCRLFGYGYYMHRVTPLQSLWQWSPRSLSLAQLTALLSVGAPLMLGDFVENLQLQIMTIFAALLSDVSLAAHTTVMQIVYLVTSPICGLHDAAVSRMGMYLGAGHAEAAAFVSRLVLGAMLFTSACLALPWVLCRHWIGLTSDPRVVDLISSATVLAAVGYVALSPFFYAMATLNAQARTVPIPRAIVCGAWFVGVPTAYALSQFDSRGLLGVYMGMAFGSGVTTLLGVYFAAFSDWVAEAAKAVARTRPFKGTLPLLATVQATDYGATTDTLLEYDEES